MVDRIDKRLLREQKAYDEAVTDWERARYMEQI